jgi:transposase
MDGEKKRKGYDRQFKIDAINMVVSGGRSVRDVAQSLGIDANTLYHWKRELLDAGTEAFPGKGHMTPQEEELKRLRRELAQAKEDREILKKALEFFSSQGKRGTRS